jgi:outer membrane protein OmpA-like peptidoglycan-associated protein
VGAVLAGEREADEILAGAAIGAVVGGGIGAYMDHQEERLTRIPGTTVERVSEDVILIHFDSDVLFDVDSAVLDPGSQGTLSQVAQVLHDYPKTAVVVQGHTDSTGAEEHNQALSERRAQAVHNYLVGRGVDFGADDGGGLRREPAGGVERHRLRAAAEPAGGRPAQGQGAVTPAG